MFSAFEDDARYRSEVSLREHRAPAGGMVLPTVRDVLALPAVEYGRPRVLAGADHLDRPVRWAHVSELPDIGGLLQGGELILTTGIALPEEGRELARYAGALAEAGASALVVELGRRFTALPPSLTRTCEAEGLPLVALRREVKFVKITEAVYSLIVDEQLAALHLSEQAHATFTALCIEGASAPDFVREVARMAGAPVVFENLMHQVVAYDPVGVAVDDLLRDWEHRSRATPSEGRTSVVGPERWVVTSVEARGEMWGRLILVPKDEPSPAQIMLLERGATALTLNRLLEANRETLERQAHRSTLSDIIEHRYASVRDMHARTEALGVPTAHRALIAVVVHLPSDPPGHTSARDTPDAGLDLVADAVRAAGARALIARLRDNHVGVLLSLQRAKQKDPVLRAFAAAVEERFGNDGATGATVAAGHPVQALDDVQRSFAEAAEVAGAARASTDSKLYYELPDIQLRGLLFILGDDARLQAFVERTLGPLLEHDARHGTDLVGTLRTFLAHGRNKSGAADAAHLSRQTFYQRLATIRRVLGVDLDSAEVCTSLHAAVMALDSLRRSTAGPVARAR